MAAEKSEKKRVSLRERLAAGRGNVLPDGAQVSCFARQEGDAMQLVTSIPGALLKRAYLDKVKALSGKQLGFSARKNSVVRFRTRITEQDVETFNLEPSDLGLEIVIGLGCTLTPARISSCTFGEFEASPDSPATATT